MRFSTNQHPLACGLDLQARPMDVCMLRQDGEVVLHRHLPAAPEPLLKAMAPSRDGLVVAVACLFTWSWRADLWAQAGLPWVRGPALSRNAIHGGKANNEPIASQQIAVWLRGGLLPHASVEPAARRATRDRLRRRMARTRTRAALRGHVQQTHRPYHVPHMGQKLADQAHRPGGVERCSDPAVHKRVAVDVALRGDDDARRRALALPIVQAATPPDPQILSLRPTVPGLGTILRRGL